VAFIKNVICRYRTNKEISGETRGNMFHGEVCEEENDIEVTEKRGGKKLYEHCG